MPSLRKNPSPSHPPVPAAHGTGTAFGVVSIAAAIVLLWALIHSAAAEDATLPPPAADVHQSYTLYPGDRMQVSVFDHPDLTTILHVPVNGSVSFPLIGELTDVVGMTVEAFRHELKRRLEDGYITEAMVTISFIEFGPRTAYVMGNVKEPSAVPLSPFAPITAMQAISRVGGFSDEADRNSSHVIRDDPRIIGQKLAMPLPKSDAALEMAKDVILQPGDIVIVPRQDRIFILGQVKRPGAVNLPSQEALTVSKAISLAGGFDRFGRQTDVQIIRAGAPVKLVDVRKILSGDSRAEDPVLKPGDTVFVPETRF
jgi:polysaccharide biosynthesis/export protein